MANRELEIIEGNKLIAEFMGLKHSHGNWYRWDSENQGQGYVSELKYHTSWNALMPVVEKISSEGYCYQIREEQCKIWKPNYEPNFAVENEANTTSEAIWQTVIQFIKWHSQNQVR